MKNLIKQKYHWFTHLFWMIGHMIKYELQGNFKYSEETYYWILIHLTRRGKRIK